MQRSRAATILLCCFFSLSVWSRHSAFAQQTPQANEKERGVELRFDGTGDCSRAQDQIYSRNEGRQTDICKWPPRILFQPELNGAAAFL